MPADFLARLRASRLILWLPGYLAAAWACVEVVALLGDVFDWPGIVPKATILIAAWGLPATIVMAWYHGERGDQRMPASEILWLILCALGAILSVAAHWRTVPDAGDTSGFTATPGSRVLERSVAVLPLAGVDGNPAHDQFAEGLADAIVGVMSVNDLQAIAGISVNESRTGNKREAALRTGAAFVLDGSIRTDQADLRVRVHVVDSQSGVTLWSNEYRRSASEGVEMQEQVATHVTDVLRCALYSRGPKAGEIDSQTLAIFLRACDRAQRFDQGPEEMYEAARQVTVQAPEFSRGWSMLAMASAIASRNVAPERAEQLRTEARAAAETARSLDPTNAECDLALSLTFPFTEWRERRKLLEHALELEPGSAEANLFIGFLLAELGRMSDAAAYMRRAVALDPLSPGQRTAMAPILAATGGHAEARTLRERNSRVWPTSPSIWNNRFNGEMFGGDPAVALGMLDNIASSPVTMEQPIEAALRRFLVARRDGDRDAMRSAVRELAVLATEGRFDTPRAITASSIAGELDVAFSLADTFFSNPRIDPGNRQPVMTAHRYFLFVLPGRAMRLDPRFIALANKIGLVDYWQESGGWPDFCDDPELPYDCRAEALRIGALQ